ncbi:MAG: hypothetical protein AAGA31_02300 [Bacteroidota bacterium]
MPYTEQNIRGLAINFLRQHYKLRPRSGTSGTRVVSKVHYYHGVTIDARLAYQKPDLSWFTATVEATSIDRAEEVLYRVNYFRIGVHAFLGTLFVLAVILALTQVLGGNLWQWFGRPDVYIFQVTTFLLSFMILGYGLSRLKYYRYIYAIAQFMRFHADAQWVAYDRSIFFSPLAAKDQDRVAKRHYKNMRKYYEELQRQCIRFGFGLMEIREDHVVRWLVEPSHIDQFGGQRSQLPLWVAAIQAPPVVKGLTKALPFTKPKSAPAAAPPVPTDGLTDPLAVPSYLPANLRREEYAATIVPAKKGRKDWYLQPARFGKRLQWRVRHGIRSLYPAEIRKRPGYYELPWWVVLLLFCLLLAVGGLSYWQSRWEPIQRGNLPNEESLLDKIEPLDGPNYAPEDLELLPGEYDHTRSADDLPPEEDIRVTVPPVVEETPTANGRAVEMHRVSGDGETTIAYNCLSLYRYQGTFYVLLEGEYAKYALALERAEYLNGRYGMPATVVLRHCLQPDLPGYLVYLGEVIVDEAEANLVVRQFARDYRLQTEVLVVR